MNGKFLFQFTRVYLEVLFPSGKFLFLFFFSFEGLKQVDALVETDPKKGKEEGLLIWAWYLQFLLAKPGRIGIWFSPCLSPPYFLQPLLFPASIFSPLLHFPSPKGRTVVEAFPPPSYQSPYVAVVLLLLLFFLLLLRLLQLLLLLLLPLLSSSCCFFCCCFFSCCCVYCCCLAVDIVFVLVIAKVSVAVVALFLLFHLMLQLILFLLIWSLLGQLWDILRDGDGEGLPSSVLSSSPYSKHQEYRRPCITLPLPPPLMLLGDVMAPCSSQGTTRPAVGPTAFHHHRHPFFPAHENVGYFCEVLTGHCYMENSDTSINTRFTYNC